MRRLASIAAFALVLTVPMWSQLVGGGRARGGSHVARSGGGHIGGGRSFGSMQSGGLRSGPGFSGGFTHSLNHSSWHSSSPNHPSHVHHFHHHGFDNNCFGFACQNWAWGSSWWGWGWGWGWYSPQLWSSWDDEDRRFDEDYYRQYEMANQMDQQSLAEQRLRRQEEKEDSDQDAYAPRSSGLRSAPETANQTPDPVAATILVFRDQRRQEVQNYAIVGQTVWAFSAGRTQKIPLANLDIPATENANDDRGVTFRVPGPI